jgi:hypothetical protein
MSPGAVSRSASRSAKFVRRQERFQLAAAVLPVRLEFVGVRLAEGIGETTQPTLTRKPGGALPCRHSDSAPARAVKSHRAVYQYWATALTGLWPPAFIWGKCLSRAVDVYFVTGADCPRSTSGRSGRARSLVLRSRPAISIQPVGLVEDAITEANYAAISWRRSIATTIVAYHAGDARFSVWRRQKLPCRRGVHCTGEADLPPYGARFYPHLNSSPRSGSTTSTQPFGKTPKVDGYLRVRYAGLKRRKG